MHSKKQAVETQPFISLDKTLPKYKLVIFDWDGTLMDSAAKIVSCMQLAAKQCDMPVPTYDEVGHIIGISLKPAIKQLFNIKDDELAERLVAAYKEAFVTRDTTPCPLFDGVEPLLSNLKEAGCTLAVATGKARRGLDRAWAFAEGVVVVPSPLSLIAMFDQPRLGRAGIQIAIGYKGIVGQRVVIRCLVISKIVRVAHRPAVRLEVDDVKIIRGT